MIDCDAAHLGEVRRILRRIVPDCEVRVFNSRFDGPARRYSDLDLVVIGKERLPHRTIETLKDTFSISDLPFVVDVVDWYALSEGFQKEIMKRSEKLEPGGG